MNLLPCNVSNDRTIQVTGGDMLQIPSDFIPEAVLNRKVYLGMRPEHVLLHTPGVQLQIEMVEILGSEQLIHGRQGDAGFIIRCPVEATRQYPIQQGEAIQVGIGDAAGLHWFDYNTGQRIE